VDNPSTYPLPKSLVFVFGLWFFNLFGSGYAGLGERIVHPLLDLIEKKTKAE
jgi:hypothetical protein